MKNDIIIKEVANFMKNISNLDDNIDKILAPYKDYTDTISDLALPIKSTLSVLNLAKRIKFKSFLKKFAVMIENESEDENFIKRLEIYLQNESNLEFVAEIIDSSIDAKSSKCSAVLGYFAGVILKQLREIEYRDLVVINALKIMINQDLFYYITLYERFFNQEGNESFRIYDMKEEIATLGIPTFQLENTIEKLKGVQAIGYDVGGYDNVGNAWGAFTFNENSKYLYVVIDKSGIKEIVTE